MIEFKIEGMHCESCVSKIQEVLKVIDGIEEVIRKHGADVHDDWWTHTKESYYKFVDQNVKDNAAHKPWSCHKVPPGASRIK